MAQIKKPVDPYGMWALDTSFRVLERDKRPGEEEGRTPVFDFIVELNEGATTKVQDSIFSTVKGVKEESGSHSASSNDSPKPMAPYIPNLYLDGLTRFVTLRVNVGSNILDQVKSLVAAILKNEYVVRIQMGQPRYRVMDRKGQLRNESDRKNANVILGIMDNACPYAHAAFRDLGETTPTSRVVAHWDQSSLRKNTGTKWEQSAIFYYGAEVSRADMCALMAQHAFGSDVDEDALYAQEKIYPLRKRFSHGAMVSTLMAGAQAMPAHPAWRNHDYDAGPADLSRMQDAAARAPIIAVNFPWEHVRDHAGRWMATNALDGLRYIMDRANTFERTGNPAQKPPVVVTLSYGAFAGSHDGTSLLESAIDELTDTVYKDRLAVVLPVGNHHGTPRLSDEDGQSFLTQRQRSNLHAKFELHKEGRGSQQLTLFVPPEKRSETCIEIWFHRLKGGKLTPLHANEKFKLTVSGPGGVKLTASLGGSALYPVASKDPVAGLYFYPRVAQSNLRSMALLMLAPTHMGDDSVFVPSGQWTIDVACQSDDPVCVDAYVERDDETVGAQRDQAARFVAVKDAPLTDEDMFSDVATGHSTFRVGALQDIGLGTSGSRVSPYSASDKAKGGPEFSALVDYGVALAGMRVSGSQSGMVVRANGTSLAAPQAARWIANELAKSPSVTALRATLPKGGSPRKGRMLLP